MSISQDYLPTHLLMDIGVISNFSNMNEVTEFMSFYGRVFVFLGYILGSGIAECVPNV
jgi:hypothetical protein